MEQQRIYNAGIYCRLSLDDGNAGDSSSIQTQKLMLEKYCNEQGFKIYDFYVDDGYSGLNYDRPDFQRLLNDIDGKKINLVITKDLSRLGRDYIQTGYYTEIYFQSKDIRYIALNDGIDTNKSDNDIAPFKNILNDMYAKDLSRKVKSAKRQRALQGMFIGGVPPFGYKKNPANFNQLIVDESAAETVREIFRLAINGKGVLNIAKELKRQRRIIPSAYKVANGSTRFIRHCENKGEEFYYTWRQPTLAGILKDRVYVGDMVNCKHEIKNYKTKIRTKVPTERRIVVENTHEPIISRDDFDRAQTLISARHRKPKKNLPNIFKSIVFCECGYRMHIMEKNSYNGRRPFYKCPNRYLNPDKCKNYNYVYYDELYAIVFERLKKAFKALQSDELLLQSIQDSAVSNVKPKNVVSEKAKIEKRLKELVHITKKLYEDNACGLLDNDSYQEILKGYQAEQKTLAERLGALEKELSKENDLAINLQKLKETTEHYLGFTELAPNMLHSLIDRIEVSYPKKINGELTQEIHIVYRYIGSEINLVT